MDRSKSPKQRISLDQWPVIARAYQELESSESISRRYGVSRQRIYQILRQQGVQMAKPRAERSCGHCRAQLAVLRWKARKSRRSFCDMGCYTAWIRENGRQYHEWRHGARYARDTVWRFYSLKDGDVVHHINGDQRDNQPHNLMVFASQGEHLRWHRLGGEHSGVIPLWRGDHI